MLRNILTLILLLIIQISGWSQISKIEVTSANGTFDTLTAGNVVYYQYAWDEPLDEDYPVTVPLNKPLKAFEIMWDSMRISDGSVRLVSSAAAGATLILDATGWDLKDKGWQNDTLGLLNISPITVSKDGYEVEWLSFGFSNELDTLNDMPSIGSVKIRIDSNQRVHFIYGDFAMVRPDLCFEGLGGLHPSVTLVDPSKTYTTYYIIGDPDAPEIDTISNQALDHLPVMGQILTLDFKKTNSYRSISASTVKVYPNPAQNILYISESLPVVGTEFSIHSTEGRIINSGTMESHSIDISELKNGCYFLWITNGNKTYYSKFIKANR